VSPFFDSPAGIEKIKPLLTFVTRYQTRYSDRVCGRWVQCGTDDYAEQLPVDDGQGFLIKPLVCKRLTPKPLGSYYQLVDGYKTRDRDNVWVKCTECDPDTEYRYKVCSLQADTICIPRTVCDPSTQYVHRLGSSSADTVCGRKTLCTAYSERGMYQIVAAIDSTDFRINGTDTVCANYSRCGHGYYQSFAGERILLWIMRSSILRD
jgi:hypothetical protein